MEEILERSLNERSLSEHSRSESGYWRQLNRRDEPGSNRQEIQGFSRRERSRNGAAGAAAANAIVDSWLEHLIFWLIY
ncbi:hypothetical protein HanIR_Chr13g0652531 [Helianthus annuus]|nr:hypothetical protein HanIR_Chr13g0652531 [Helianthus annuus]